MKVKDLIMNNLINKKIKSVVDNYPAYAIEFTDGTVLGFTVDPSATPNDIFTEGC